MSPDSATLKAAVRIALDRFVLDVDFATRGRVVGLFGPSGAGKSTLLETVAGIRRRAEGTVRFGDQTWLDSEARVFVPPERRGIGHVPQRGLLFPHLDVAGNLGAGRDAGRRPGADVQSVASLLELTPLLHRDVAALSGGERQRVALGRALCSGARLLLLDEPLASLDVPLRRRLLPLLRRVRDEHGVPMLLVSHDPIEVQALCDDLIVLKHGAIVAQGTPREALTDEQVFPLARREGFQNVVPCRWKETRSDVSVLALGERPSAVELATTADVAQDVEAELFVTIPADEIVIAVQPPSGLSARNLLPARIEELRGSGRDRLVLARLHDDVPPIGVEVTSGTCEHLDLRCGRDVHLVIKATSCAVLGVDA